MLRSNILTVTLNPAVDKIVKVDNFSLGKDFRSQEMSVCAGGKGINVSRGLRQLGLSTNVLGFAGGCTGKYLIKMLNREGIGNSFLKVNNETRTNLTIVNPENSQVTRVLEPGPLVSIDEQNKFKNKFANSLTGIEYAIFSGSLPQGVADDFYSQLIQIAKSKNIKTVLDASGKAFLRGIYSSPFLIKPNLDEASFTLGMRLRTLIKIKKAVQYFLDLGISIVIISLGDKGAVFSCDEQVFYAQPPIFRRPSSVGCGDALLSGFVFSHYHKKDFTDCVAMACACGSANCLAKNFGEISLVDVKKILSKVKIKKI